ncbi:hypothetical protein TIFTF001_032946 [Ficus carica]|uniref:Reverse transcriptase zinc-binding domain-containing protein n=1 Tax=Ficus carica TaxID=3494 RepID=A0AA88J329_FICCA|nr:hypothetical protein TIFTF001_032946 [Ficus carica]
MGEKCVMSELMRARYLMNFRKIRSGYVTSSFWPALRDCYSELLGECIWIVANNPAEFCLKFPNITKDIQTVIIADETNDELRWKLCSMANLGFGISMKLHGINLRRKYTAEKGFSLDSFCRFCYKAEEDLDHIFIHCDFVKTIWFSGYS